MSSEAAVPLALLTVEALTNAFKHAFAPGQGGTISVTLAPGGEGRLRSPSPMTAPASHARR